MRLLALSRDDFLSVLTGQDPTLATFDVPQAVSGPGEWTPSRRAEVLCRINLLSHLDQDFLRGLAANSHVDRWPSGAYVVRQGEGGDRFFVVLEGRVTVAID